MLADPQSVTINTVATSLALTGDTPTKRSYTSSDGTVRLDVSQLSTSGRFRREFRLSQSKIAADPISAVNKEVSASIIIAVDEPKYGFSNTELGYLIDAVIAAYSSSQHNKILGGEM